MARTEAQKAREKTLAKARWDALTLEQQEAKRKIDRDKQRARRANQTAGQKQHVKDYMAGYRKDNKESIGAQRAEYRLENKELLRQDAENRRSSWSEDRRAQANERQLERHRERLEEYTEEEFDNYLSYKRSHGRKTKASRRLRVPKWLDNTEMGKINEIYKRCVVLEKKTGIPHHVDHILPLHGKLVSGLHVPSNLQILTAKENMRKSINYTI